MDSCRNAGVFFFLVLLITAAFSFILKKIKKE